MLFLLPLLVLFTYSALLLPKFVMGDADFSEYSLIQPKHFNWYQELRKKCQWKIPARLHPDAHSNCPGKMYECLMKMSLPVGDGYLHISRFGPYTTRGDYEQVFCRGDGHVALKNAWLIGGVSGAYDPFTDKIMEFPPIHNHHLITKKIDFPRIPDQYLKFMPWLPYLQTGSSAVFYPYSTSDMQCLPGEGGIGCLSSGLPSGYGRRTYDTKDATNVFLHVQDARQGNSPPISHMIEMGAIYITKFKSELLPIKPVISAALEICGNGPPFTYKLKYNTPMYQFVTYYFAVKTEFVGARMHWHARPGDEAWIVRGTQNDLGIPQSIQRPTVYKAGKAPVGEAIEIDSGGYEMLLKRYESNIAAAAAKAQAKQASRKLKKDADDDDAETDNSESFFNPFDVKNNAPKRPSPYVPEILCKYFGKSEQVTVADLKRQCKEELQLLQSTGQIKNTQEVSDMLNYLLKKLDSKEPTHRHTASRALQYMFAETPIPSNVTDPRDPHEAAAAAEVRKILAELNSVNESFFDASEFYKYSSEGNNSHVMEQRELSVGGSVFYNKMRHYNKMFGHQQPLLAAPGIADPGPKTAWEQWKAKYDGILSGSYYRVGASSDRRGSTKYKQCDRFIVEAGQFITVMHFDVPRVRPSETDTENRFDPVVLTGEQHTTLNAFVHMPEVKWM